MPRHCHDILPAMMMQEKKQEGAKKGQDEPLPALPCQTSGTMADCVFCCMVLQAGYVPDML